MADTRDRRDELRAGDLDSVEVSLPANGTAPAAARSLVRAVLLRWGLPTLVDAAVLAISELTTNALLHGGPPLVIRLRHLAGEIRVEVHDTGASPPPSVPTTVPVGAESGRGLSIVTALAAETGVEQVAGDGKWVYATFRRPALA